MVLLEFAAQKLDTFIGKVLTVEYRVWTSHKTHIIFVVCELTMVHCDLAVHMLRIITTFIMHKLALFPRDSNLDYYFHYNGLSLAQVQV